MRTNKSFLGFCFALVMTGMPGIVFAQVNSGSSGIDGALDFSSIGYTTNIVINMADHPTGIYQYTYVNIPNGVTVTFIRNANNTPVYWLVQSNVVIDGSINVSGQDASGSQGGQGGPGGWAGGNGTPVATTGQGPGGGSTNGNSGNYNYANSFLFPLLGGSGGGGSWNGGGGGGGGSGAILIAASGQIIMDGNIEANGGDWSCIQGGDGITRCAGRGSGGGIRLVALTVNGRGSISGGAVRIDAYTDNFAGYINTQFTQGSQFVIFPSSGQLSMLTVTSVGGISVPASPTGILTAPDAIISAQQNNPIPVVVSCSNLPLNTPITVSVKPANGSIVTAMGYNTTGTQTSSTATVSIVIPHGGGIIYATAATGN